jgi:hypothetical protein
MDSRAVLDAARVGRSILYVGVRIEALVAFGYWSYLFGPVTIDLLTPKDTIRGIYGPVLLSGALAAAVGVSLLACYQVLRSRTIARSSAWLIRGAVLAVGTGVLAVVLDFPTT